MPYVYRQSIERLPQKDLALAAPLSRGLTLKLVLLKNQIPESCDAQCGHKQQNISREFSAVLWWVLKKLKVSLAAHLKRGGC